MSALAKSIAVAIANGQSLSAAVPLGSAIVIGIEIPAAWTTANLTFQASADDTTYLDVYDSAGTELTVTVGGVSRHIALDQTLFVGFSSIKVRSGTTGTPVAQGGARTVTLVTKDY